MKFQGFRTKMKERFNRQKIVQFLDKQGFYIVLFICIAIIGATALWTSRNNSPAPQEETPPTEQIAEEEQNKPAQSSMDESTLDVKVEDKETKENKETTKTQTTDASKTSNTKASTAKAASASASSSSKSKSIPKLIEPVSGETAMVFADKKLVYSKTLEQWTTHNGLDIIAKEGTEVKAALGGVVEKTEEDATMGKIILIDHGNGLKTKYAGLSTLDMVKVGQKVERGDTISAVGNTAVFEVSEGPHLHFEVILDGKNVDPEKYMIK